jgi:hypothetical protein
MPSGEHHEGAGTTLHDAAQAAYETARGKGHQPPFEVVRIELHGSNPFTEYKLFVAPMDTPPGG